MNKQDRQYNPDANHVFIGDNLTWLQSDYAKEDTYDFIYLDPPYNTKSRLSYHDSREDWNSWIEQRLLLTKRLMSNDGALFISIDDSKLIELCIICDKIFGRENRVGILITHQAMRSNSKHINIIHEYIVVYARDIKKLPAMSIRRLDTDEAEIIHYLESVIATEHAKNVSLQDAQEALRHTIKDLTAKKPENAWLKNYRYLDDAWRIFYPKDLSLPGTPHKLDIDAINLHLQPLKTRNWCSAEHMQQLWNEHRIYMLNGRPYEKLYIDDARMHMPSILPFWSRQGTADLRHIGCDDLFDTPKPVVLIQTLIMSLIGTKQDFRVLDYFAGSGTTAQAAAEAAEKTGCNIKWNLVQTNEQFNDGTKPYNAAIKLGIKPTISQALEYRLQAYEQASKNENIKHETIII